MHEIVLTSIFDLQLLGFWMVVNIINTIARGIIHVCSPHQLWSLRSECWWERST